MDVDPDRVPRRLRLLSLSENALVELSPAADHLVVLTRWGEIRVDGVDHDVYESLRRMSLGPVNLENLPIRRDYGQTDPPHRPHRLEDVLEQLGCCVVQSLGLDDEAGPLLSVVPVTREATVLRPTRTAVDRPIRLSRFAVMRPHDDDLVLESPVSDYRVVLHRPKAASVVTALPGATTADELATRLKLAEPVVADIVSYLVASGLVQAGAWDRSGTARFAEDGDPRLLPWALHDLQFHVQTRIGRDTQDVGTTLAHADWLAAAPVVKPAPAGPRFQLYRPVLAEVAAGDPSLTAAIEARRSGREFSDRPLDAQQVGELLFRVARVRWTRRAVTADGAEYTVSDRPYPSTSDLYELELYVSIDRCTGLPRATFHYDPGEHALTLVSDSGSALDELLDTARAACGSHRRPPVLITMTSRMARLSWMYGAISYSLTLKHVGELQQTFFLVASAMGLASCAPAVVDSTADAALGLQWPDEVSVGEFSVGFGS